jgi:hypothetical protein
MDKKMSSQLDTVQSMVNRLEDDIEDECVECFEHHIEVISSTLYGILYTLQGEEELEASNS